MEQLTSIMKKKLAVSPLAMTGRDALGSKDGDDHGTAEEEEPARPPSNQEIWNRRRSVTIVTPIESDKMAVQPRRRSSSLSKNGAPAEDELYSLQERVALEDSQALENFLQKKKSSFKQRTRAMSVMKLQVSRGRLQSISRQNALSSGSVTAPVASSPPLTFLTPEPPVAEETDTISSPPSSLHSDNSDPRLPAPTPSPVPRTSSQDSSLLDPSDMPSFPSSRRGSYLHFNEHQASRCLSRSSSQSSHVGDDVYITPFAQILANMYLVRSNFIDLMGLPQSMQKGPLGVNAEDLSEENKKHVAMGTVHEFDWCLEQLETMHSSKSIGGLAQAKFKQLLIRGLSSLSENSRSGSQVAEWVSATYTDGAELVDRVLDHVPLRVNTGSAANVFEELPRFGVYGPGVNEDRIGRLLDNSIDKWTLDVFELGKAAGGRPIVPLAYYIFKRRKLFKAFKIPPNLFIAFVSEVETHYWSTNPYHNAYHGADVLHTTNNMLNCSALQTIFTDLEIMAALFAAFVHDVGHPGRNNNYLIATGHELAILYNDESILENHHLAVVFKILNEPTFDFLVNMDAQQRKAFRKMVIDMVLATDMAKHLHHLGELKTMVETQKVSSAGLLVLDQYTDRSQVLQSLVHCADLSNPSKDVAMAAVWAKRVLDEFFLQGDEEKNRGLPVSPLMDRDTVVMEKCQASFIDFVVYPLWEVWAELVYPHSQFVLDRLHAMQEYWTDMIPTSPSHLVCSDEDSAKVPLTPPDTPLVESREDGRLAD